MWKIRIGALENAMEDLDALLTDISVSTSWFEKSAFNEVWYFEALLDYEPNIESMKTLLYKENISYNDIKIEVLEDKDWLAENRKTFQPINIGPFFIHDSYYKGNIPANVQTLVIDAATAFGTGHHETTRFCLELLLQLYSEKHVFDTVLDLGCGTGILGMAAYRLWKNIVILSDNDPEAIVRTAMNLNINECKGITVVAEGFEHNLIQKQESFDLILANILAEPLIDLAPVMTNYMANSYCILSGILVTQSQDVITAYEKQGFIIVNHIFDDLWSALLLKK